MHVEWGLEWSPAAAGVHAFTLADVDFDLPDPAALPVTGASTSLSGRSLLSDGPARIAASGAEAALAHLRRQGLLGDHAFADRLTARSSALAEEGGRAGMEVPWARSRTRTC